MRAMMVVDSPLGVKLVWTRIRTKRNAKAGDRRRAARFESHHTQRADDGCCARTSVALEGLLTTDSTSVLNSLAC